MLEVFPVVQKCTSCTQVHEHELHQSHKDDNRDSRKKVFVKDSRLKRKNVVFISMMQ